MRETIRPSGVIRFGVFEVDLRGEELRKSGLKLRLRGQAFQVLAMLLERPGEVVTREELQQRLWPEGTFVDFDHGLNTAINKIREVLGDSAETPHYVETLPRRGYRFIASVDGMGLTRTAERTSPKIQDVAESAAQVVLRDEAAQARAGVRRRRVGIFLLLGVMLASAIGSITWVRHSHRGSHVLAPPMKTYPLTSFVGHEFDPALSPDGKQIAFVWRGEKDDNADIYVQLVGTGRPLRLTTDAADDLEPAWSPDGRYLAFVRVSKERAGFYLIPSLGGPERKLADAYPFAFSHSLDWSPDGKLLAVEDQPSEREPPSLFLLVVANGERRRLTSPPLAYSRDAQPSFSPDRKTLAFSRAIGFSSVDIYLVALTGGEPKRLTFDNTSSDPAWAPDGLALVFSSQRAGSQGLWRIPVSGGEPRQIAAGHLSHPSFPRQGNRLAYVEHIGDTNVWQIEDPTAKRDHNGRVKLISSTRRDDAAEFSPDGNRIVFASTRSGNYELWMCESDGSNPRQLTFFGEGSACSARWSPDGGRIVFDFQRGEQFSGIYVMSAEGGEPRRLPTGSSADFVPSWSRDGQWIYFCSTRTGDFQICKISVEGGEAIQVTKQGGYNPMESLDGKFLYHERECSPKAFVNTEIWRLSLENGEDTLVIKKAGVERYWALAKYIFA
jgi:Tol biopolymer transport system component/DNA-binding winged helix-turn-helix (wHTH) protein